MPESVGAKKGTAVGPAKPAVTAGRAEELMVEVLTTAETPRERAQAFEIADVIRQGQMVRRVASIVAATEWGGAMSPERQYAFARYCLALGADPLRHVDILGGNPFVNGDYYRDVIAANPDFDHSEDPVWMHDDPRLARCVLCGKPFEADLAHGHAIASVTAENERRLDERIARSQARLDNAIQEETTGACVVVLRYKSRGPFKGIGEVHVGKTAKGYDRDPIGLENPRTTAETRAWREAGEKAEPTWFRTHASTLAALETNLRETYTAERKLAAAPEEPPRRSEVLGDEEPEVTSAAVVAPKPDPDGVRMVKHNPNARCTIETSHAASLCPLEPEFKEGVVR